MLPLVRWSTRALAFALALAAFSVSPAARADEQAELEKARAAYLAKNYDEAATRFSALVDPEKGIKDPTLLSQARMYWGGVLIARGDKKGAIEVFEKLMLDDALFEPDPLSFSSEIINTFIDVRAKLRERLKAAAAEAARAEAARKARDRDAKERYDAWLAKVVENAQERQITVRHSRVVACVPFGAGQLQNGQPVLGFTLMGLEAALVAGTVATVPMYAYARDRANEEAASRDLEGKAQAYQDRASTIRFVNLGLAGSLLVVAAAGVIQANLSFVPESKETERRPLPPLSRVRPFLSPVSGGEGARAAAPSGAVVGLSGLVF